MAALLQGEISAEARDVSDDLDPRGDPIRAGRNAAARIAAEVDRARLVLEIASAGCPNTRKGKPACGECIVGAEHLVMNLGLDHARAVLRIVKGEKP